MSRLRRTVPGAVLLFAQLFALAAMAQAPTPATYVGEKVCAQCHDAENKQFGHTLHAKVFRLNPKNETEKRVCEACHGPGSNHDKLLQAARPFLCQQCHGNPAHPSILNNAGQSLGGGAAANSRVLGRSCQVCHSQIHGSNHPGGARFQR